MPPARKMLLGEAKLSLQQVDCTGHKTGLQKTRKGREKDGSRALSAKD